MNRRRAIDVHGTVKREPPPERRAKGDLDHGFPATQPKINYPFM